MEELHYIFPLVQDPSAVKVAAQLDQAGVDQQAVSQNTADFVAIVDNTKLWKTSLLFQGAVTHASKGHNVVYISRTPLSSLPPPVDGMPRPDPMAMQQVKMLYMQNKVELEKYLAGLHQQVILPQAIFIDELQDYVKQAGDDRIAQGLYIARLSALLRDSLHYMKTKHGDISCILTGMQEMKISHNTLRKYLFPLLSIRKADNAVGDEELYTIVKEGRYDETAEGPTVLFRLRNGCLCLDALRMNKPDGEEAKADVTPLT